MSKMCQYEIIIWCDDNSTHTILVEGTRLVTYALNDMHAVLSIYDGDDEVFVIGMSEKVRAKRVLVKNEIRVVKSKRKHLESIETGDV